MQSFDYKDVILRAIKILETGPLPHRYASCGEWCPWCAISLAKTQLDDEHKTGIPLSDVINDISGEIEYNADLPLVFARRALKEWSDEYSNKMNQARALEILKKASTIEVINGSNNFS